jgi:hypothetical protein
MSEKAKTDKPAKQRINRYGFLALWIIAPALARYLFYYLAINGVLWYLPQLGLFNGIYYGLIHGIIIAAIQKLALYLHFGRSFAGWTRATFLGWMFGGIALMAINWNIDLPLQWILVLQAVTITLIPTLAQAWILRRSIQQAWLWLLSWGVGSTVFSLIYMQNLNQDFTAYTAHGAFAAVTGLTLLWLFGMQSKEIKLKNQADTSRLEDGTEDEAALERSELQREREQAQ